MQTHHPAPAGPSSRAQQGWGRRNPVLMAVGLGVAVVATVASCGGSSSTTTTAASPAPSSSGSRTPPGVTGTIAAVAPGNIQVQNPQQGQVRVDYTNSTTITDTVPATRAALTVGACASIFSGGGAASAAASGPVQTVTISQPVNGSCTNQFGRGDRSTPPTPRASRSPGGRGQVGGFGKITAVTADGFTVQPDRPANAAARTFQTSASTTYLTVNRATPTALVVGRCVTAIGPSDDTGAVQATSISVRPAGPNGCVGFGRRQGASGGASSGA